MNFISKILKKPNSKQDVKAKRKNKNRNRRAEEEEYIDVELELEEEERPQVPLFIGGAGGGKSPNDAGSALTGDQDEFLDEEEDDLELGEEAGTLYVKQHHQHLHQHPQNRSSGTLIRPTDVPPIRPPSFGPPRQSQDPAFYAPELPPYIAPPSMPLHHIPPETVEPPYNAHSSGGYMDHGYSESTIYQEYTGMPPQMIPPGPMTPYFPPRVTPTTSFHQPMHDNTPTTSFHQPIHDNYWGFTETEMFDFQQLISSGVPEAEAMRTIEYNRILHHQNSSISRSMQHVPPSILDEEEQIYQIILKESVEEERKRQERFRQRPERYDPQHNCTGLSSEEALTIALQQSQDDFERSKRSQATTPASSRPLGANRTVSQSTVSLDIERANEDALRQAILLSLQEAEAKQTPVNRRFPHPTPMIPRDQTNHLEAQSARYLEFSKSRSPIPTNGHSRPQLYPTSNHHELRPEYPQPSPLVRDRSGGPARTPPLSQGAFDNFPDSRFPGRHQQPIPVSQEYPEYSPYEENQWGAADYGTNQPYEEYSEFPPQDASDFPQEYPYDDDQYEEVPPEAEAHVAASTMPVATLMSRLFPATEDESDRDKDFSADDEPTHEIQYQYQEQHQHQQQSGGHHAAHMIMAHQNPHHRSLQGHANNPHAERSNRAIVSLQSQSLDSDEVPASRKPFQSKLSMASMASTSSDNGGDHPSERAIVVSRLRSRQGDNYLSDTSGSSATNFVRRGSTVGRPGGPARQFTAPRSALTSDDSHNK